jgi:hypothetical protein
MNQFEIELPVLNAYMDKVKVKSKALIEGIIKSHSPIQVDNDVDVPKWKNGIERHRVTKIELYAKDSWGIPGTIFSFRYWGIPLSKKGEPMKNRNPVEFNHFINDGKELHMPSYNRLQIIPAKMFVGYGDANFKR